METDELIRRLVADAKPVRRLPHAAASALFWLAIGLPVVAIVVLSSHLGMMHTGASSGNRDFLVEQLAAFVTAVTAAIAAFSSIVPGFDRRMLLLPVLPLIAWLSSVGHSCMQDWLQFRADGLAIESDWSCLPPALIMGVVPTAAMLIMLRRGAPVYPRTTLLLGALAVAALVNFGLQFYHARDAAIIILVWHVGGALLFSFAAGSFGSALLAWPDRASSN